MTGKALFARLGVRPGRQDSLYLAVLELVRRNEDLEARIAALEQQAPRRTGERLLTAVARAMGRA